MLWKQNRGSKIMSFGVLLLNLKFLLLSGKENFELENHRASLLFIILLFFIIYFFFLTLYIANVVSKCDYIILIEKKLCLLQPSLFQSTLCCVPVKFILFIIFTFNQNKKRFLYYIYNFINRLFTPTKIDKTS